MLYHRKKIIGKSVYNISCLADNKYTITETRNGRTEEAKINYYNCDEAMEILKYIDKEYFIMKEE